MEIPNSAYNKKDERDYKYSDIFKEEMAGQELPTSFILDNVDYQNQWLDEITKMACVYYSSWHGSNEENFQEWSEVRIDNKELAIEAIKLWRLDLARWAAVSDWPRTIRDLWYISWWAMIEDISWAKASIFNKRPIVVWSNKINWNYWDKAPFVLKWPSGSGHAILIIWYDDNLEWGCFIIKNSYWTEKNDWGKFYLRYVDFWLLFLWKYSLIDLPDAILTYKKNIMDNINIPMAKVGFELGLYNWLDSQKSATREETVTMILRTIEKMYNWDITKELLLETIKKYNA